MSDQDAFARIVAAFHDAALDDALWPATSALIDAACGMVGNALLIRDGLGDDGRVLFVGLYYRGERREYWEREYLTVYYPINEAIPRLQHLPDSRVVPTTALYTPQELRTSPTYNEAFRLGNSQDGLNVRLDGSDTFYLVWHPLDPVTRGGWGSSQLTLINALLPHLRQFVRVRQALVGAEALGASVTALLDNTRVGIIYLDRSGRIVAANDRAQDLLRCGDGVTDQGGVLRARAPADRTRLERLIGAALPTSSGPAVSGSMTLQRGSLLPRFMVHIKPVSNRQQDYGTPRVAALVLVVEPRRPPHIDPNLVAQSLGLTPGESRVAVWIAEGWRVREIAAATGRTEKAIRWHLQQIYHKQGISRQADLVRLVLSLTTFT